VPPQLHERQGKKKSSPWTVARRHSANYAVTEFSEVRAGEEVEIYEAAPCCRCADSRWSRSYGASPSLRLPSQTMGDATRGSPIPLQALIVPPGGSCV
jgi:hypothetical protein